MRVNVSPGKYVIAVSGGVDSMALLELLRGRPGVMLVVAHYDHGIRPDSAADRLLVRYAAEAYGLAFESEEGQLGPKTGESVARAARYRFLRRVRRATGARAIITAHHRDDVLETMVINLLRGTGRKGLSSLTSTPELVRPLLGVSKRQIMEYAQARQLEWHEDTTNLDTGYLRNRVRHQLLPGWTEGQKRQLLAIGHTMTALNSELDGLLKPIVAGPLRRQWFAGLSNSLALEVMAGWLRSHGRANFDRPTLQRLVVAAKVGRAGSLVEAGRHRRLRIGDDELILTTVGEAGAAVRPPLALRVQER